MAPHCASSGPARAPNARWALPVTSCLQTASIHQFLADNRSSAANEMQRATDRARIAANTSNTARLLFIAAAVPFSGYTSHERPFCRHVKAEGQALANR